jgi:hypothetical protein
MEHGQPIRKDSDNITKRTFETRFTKLCDDHAQEMREKFVVESETKL